MGRRGGLDHAREGRVALQGRHPGEGGPRSPPRSTTSSSVSRTSWTTTAELVRQHEPPHGAGEGTRPQPCAARPRRASLGRAFAGASATSRASGAAPTTTPEQETEANSGRATSCREARRSSRRCTSRRLRVLLHLNRTPANHHYALRRRRRRLRQRPWRPLLLLRLRSRRTLQSVKGQETQTLLRLLHGGRDGEQLRQPSGPRRSHRGLAAAPRSSSCTRAARD